MSDRSGVETIADRLEQLAASLDRQWTAQCDADDSGRARLVVEIIATQYNDVVRELRTAAAELRALREQRDDYREAYEDSKRLAREIDVALHGEANTAKQASLCDLVPLAMRLRAERDDLRSLLDNWRGWAQFVFNGGGGVAASDEVLRQQVCERYDADLALSRSITRDTGGR